MTLRFLHSLKKEVKPISVRYLISHSQFKLYSTFAEVTTIEGLIDRGVSALEQDQVVRRIQDPEGAAKIDIFVGKLRALKLLAEPISIIFEDISGNCHVENPNAPAADPDCSVTHFRRTKEQDNALGIYAENEDEALLKPIQEGEYSLEQIQGEVLTFPTNCPNCNSPCDTNMKMTSILFKKN